MQSMALCSQQLFMRSREGYFGVYLLSYAETREKAPN